MFDRKDVLQDFVTGVLPQIREAYEQDGVADGPARREAWNNLVDMYVKDGIIDDANEIGALPDYLDA